MFQQIISSESRIHLSLQPRAVCLCLNISPCPPWICSSNPKPQPFPYFRITPGTLVPLKKKKKRISPLRQHIMKALSVTGVPSCTAGRPLCNTLHPAHSESTVGRLPCIISGRLFLTCLLQPPDFCNPERNFAILHKKSMKSQLEWLASYRFTLALLQRTRIVRKKMLFPRSTPTKTPCH